MKRSLALPLALFEAMQLNSEAVALVSAGKPGGVKRMKAAERAMRTAEKIRALPDDADVPWPFEPWRQ